MPKRFITALIAFVLFAGTSARGAEQLVDLAYTTVAAGGYTAGSGVLNVASTSTGSGALPFPMTGVFSVSIADPTTHVVKTLLEVTAINSATQFATTSAAGLDVNAVIGDLVEAVQDKRSLTAFVQGPAWVGLSYSNGWADLGGGYQAGAYTRDGTGRVWTRGTIMGGTLTGGTTVFTLPAGFRPPVKTVWPVIATLNGSPFQVTNVIVNTDGTVTIGISITTGASSLLYLENLSFSVN
ncbi:MAG: hypothetical protein V4502_06070 [Pseudomonadota bacterium]